MSPRGNLRVLAYLTTYVVAVLLLVRVLGHLVPEAQDAAVERAVRSGDAMGMHVVIEAHPEAARDLAFRWMSIGLSERAAGKDSQAADTLALARRLSLGIEAVLSDEALKREVDWALTSDFDTANRFDVFSARLARVEEWVDRRQNLDRAHEAAVEISESFRDDGNEIATLRARHVAATVLNLTHSDRTESVYRSLLKDANELGHRHIEGAATNNLAYLYEARGRFDEALRGYSRTRSMGARHGIRRLSGFGSLYAGNLYHRMGMPERAAEYLSEAEGHFRSIGERRLQAAAASNLGAAFQVAGGRKQAIHAYRRALSLSPNRVSSTHLNLAELLLDEGKSSEARVVLRNLTGREDIGPYLRWGAWITYARLHREALELENSLACIEQARRYAHEAEFRLLEIETDTAEAEIHLARRNYGAAENLLSRAVGELDQLRDSAEYAEERIRFLDAQSDVYRMLLRVRTARKAPLEDLFAIAERFRSRALLDSLEGGAVLSRRVESGRAALERALPKRGAPVTFRDLSTELARTAGSGALHITVLGEDVLLITATSDGDATARVVSTEGEDLREMARTWSSGLARNRIELSENAAHASATLSKYLVEPVSGFLEGVRELIVVPDPTVFSLPFSALSLAGKPLVRERSVLVTPSASVFVRLRRRLASRPPSSHAVIVASPSNPGSRRLPDAEEEGLAIARVVEEARLLAGSQATEQSVRAAIDGAGIVHFGGHARLEPRLPLSSSLELAHGQLDGADPSASGLVLSPIEDDGRLTGYEILERELAEGALVTLAGCETLALDSGRGIAGLSRAFFEVGASTVVATRWPVEDRATRELMARFYEELVVRKRSRTEAFSEAQRRFLLGEAGERFQHPYYWAGFVILGAS